MANAHEGRKVGKVTYQVPGQPKQVVGVLVGSKFLGNYWISWNRGHAPMGKGFINILPDEMLEVSIYEPEVV